MARRTRQRELNDHAGEETSGTVRVGIVSWNTASLLDDCLNALPAALDGTPAEVVVVDNASSDNSVEVAARHGVTIIVNRENVGYAVAMNQALASHASVLVALNPDTVPGPGTIAGLVRRLQDEPEAGVVVPRLVGIDGRHQHSAYRFPSPRVQLAAATATHASRTGPRGRRLFLEGSGPHPDGPIDWAIGAVHVIRSSALSGEAPYCERSFMYAEDLDLCWRLARRGWSTVLAADVSVLHIGNVAGELAWGHRRSLRYWEATYDVASERIGLRRTRLLALSAGVAAGIGSGRSILRGGRNRWPSVRLRLSEARVHFRAALLGPRPSLGGPDRESSHQQPPVADAPLGQRQARRENG